MHFFNRSDRILQVNIILENSVTFPFTIHRKAFFETHMATWQLCVKVCMFMFWLATSLVLFAIGSLFFYLATHEPGDGTHRPLVFPFWAPGIDYTTSPAYDIAFNFANIGVIACTYNYTCKSSFFKLKK